MRTPSLPDADVKAIAAPPRKPCEVFFSSRAAVAGCDAADQSRPALSPATWLNDLFLNLHVGTHASRVLGTQASSPASPTFQLCPHCLSLHLSRRDARWLIIFSVCRHSRQNGAAVSASSCRAECTVSSSSSPKPRCQYTGTGEHHAQHQVQGRFGTLEAARRGRFGNRHVRNLCRSNSSAMRDSSRFFA